MPCRDYPYEVSQTQLDKLASLLCLACQTMEKNKIVIPVDVNFWWEAHKKLDADRLAAEKAEIDRKKILEKSRNKALAKLTPAERKLLGL